MAIVKYITLHKNGNMHFARVLLREESSRAGYVIDSDHPKVRPGEIVAPAGNASWDNVWALYELRRLGCDLQAKIGMSEYTDEHAEEIRNIVQWYLEQM